MKLRAYLLLLAVFMLAACQDTPAPPTVATEPAEAPAPVVSEDETATPAAVAAAATTEPTVTAVPATEVPPEAPTATPLPSKGLTVCMVAPPQDVYLYGARSLQAAAVRHAIYENLYTTLGFDYQAQGLAEIPTTENGGFRVETVSVSRGDRVVDITGRPITLRQGNTVINAAGEPETMDEEPIEMNQMVVEFTFKPMVWSDGTPVTAADSVYSYEVAADPFTLSDKSLIEQTASYEAVDDLTVRWTGLPGHFDTLYLTNVWAPLPHHQLEQYRAIDLSTVPEATQMPLSSGPFVITTWSPEEIVLERNPHYYRAAEGLPYIDTLRFRFPAELPSQAFELITSGSCDVVTQDLIPLTAEQLNAPADEVVTYVHQGVVWENIAFGINSYTFPATDRPDWFQDPQTRRALTLCTDRQTMSEQGTFGYAEVLESYIPPEHPLYLESIESFPYDPATGNALLDELGYLDTNEDGIREDIESIRPFSITIATTPSELRVTAATILAENLANCGITAVVDVQPDPTFFDNTRDGTIFGRKFDLAIFGWVIGTIPTCDHYLSTQVTGLEEQGFAGFRGANVTGFFNGEFDAACEGGLNAFYNSPEYISNHQQALAVFDAQRPSIPLFTRPKFTLASPQILHIQGDAPQASELWNVFEWDVEE